ncbi:MAG: hypothetical protein HC808_10080, partial [Candidatus Competibacteraceae bacterium]|nr:hypothetical protein [Candidatus Competibacteraceae bacterium]
RDDLTTFIPNFVQNCENKLYRTLHLRNEETALSVSISSGVAAVPSNFKALKFAYVSRTPVCLLQWVPLEELYRDYPNRSYSEYPSVISREGANFVFGPVSVDGTLNGVYYAKKDPLRTTDPSWYVTNAPDVLLYGSLLESAPFIQNDQRLQVWAELYKDAVQTLKDEEKDSAVSKGQLVQRVS